MENHTPEGSGLKSFLEDTFQTMDTVLSNQHAELRQSEIGVVEYVGYGIVRVGGLPNIKAEELVLFPKNLQGLVFNIDPDEIGVILLGPGEGLQTGAEVKRTGRILDTPVGDDLIGRTLDAVGRPLDNLGEIRPDGRMPVEREAPAVMGRDPVTVPLQTGIKVIDALIPIGRGQRELIVGDRQTGKTAIAIDTIINQFDKGVLCIYCAIGKKTSDVAKVIADLKDHGAMGHTILVVATAGDPPGLQYIAPYAATTMGEYFMSRGKDVLIVYDDLTNHARAYRELSLLLRRPPGREAFPGDIFYIHSRLLERSTHLKKDHGGGSLTAIPIVETEAQDISSYIPTNLISITDGQIYLSPRLFQKGILPAVDVGKSVSRVGGKAQLPAYRAVAGDLRIAYSQFEELETFSRFGTRLDEGTRKVLERGWRVREILKQSQYDPIRVSDQIAALLAVTSGALDVIAADKVAQTESALREAMKDHHADLGHRIEAGEKLDESDRKIITDAAGETVQRLKGD